MKHSAHDLQLDQRLPQQRREWRLQRMSWLVMLALLLAITLGLFGEGPLSRTELSAPDGSLQVQLNRITRRHSVHTLHFALRSSGPALKLAIANEYLREMDVEHVFPEPRAFIAGDRATTLVFDAQPGETAQVRVQLRPATIGPVEGWVALDRGPPQAFSQFVHP